MDAAIFGLIVADLIAAPFDLRNPPAKGGLQIVNNIKLTTGGNVCNTGVAMAKLGMKVAGAGLVGNDALGAAVSDQLKRSGMDISHVFSDARAQTSATVVAVEPGGERCFYHVPGVTALLDGTSFRRCFPLFATCSIVQVGYLGLLPSLTPVLAGLLQEMETLYPNTKLALDTVNPPGPAKDLWPILPHLDVFCPSRSEAQALTDESEPKKMIAAFREHMKTGLIGIKLDEEGCILDDGKEQVVAAIYRVDVKDTTGAGDTWYAGVLTALLKQMPLKQAAQFANRAAADCCTDYGASAGVKSFEETMARL
ncbi:MAG TPA: carbohydrate kinase family protein [Tepidisphaeraceae bacterium]|jgi:sugar/nucleoside kinase (ribokinase family)